MKFGIINGLLAALCQSLVYFWARHYVQRRGPGASRQLLVLAHVWMGGLSLLVLPFVWPHGGGGAWVVFKGVAQPLAICCCFYLGGQTSLLIALKNAEPSRVSPLLGLKIIILAVLASFFVMPHRPDQPALPVGFTWLQWVAVGLCIVGAVALNLSGVRLRRRALLAIGLACMCYSISDWNITLLVMKVTPVVSAAGAPWLAAALCYGVCGIIATLASPVLGTRDPTAWRDAVPFAVLWFGGMVFLFGCFNIAGPVLGNILQSSRGLMSIVLGTLLIRWGHLHIEPLTEKGVFGRRLAAGVLMFLAVSLYVIRDPKALTMSKARGGAQGVSHGTSQQQPAR